MTHLKAGPGAGHSGSARSAITDVTFLIRALCLTVLLVTLGSVSSEAASPLMHNSENTASGKYGTWGASYTCATCHSKGTTPNIKKVSPSIPTSIGSRPVIFDRITSSRNDVTGVFGNDERTVYREGSRNVCEVCHHRTIYHNYSASKLSSSTHAEHKSNRRDCMKCHSHKLGFRPPKAGSCTDCHGDPPLTPAELSSNIYGSYPPADAGAHRQHRGDLRMACASCHNNYGHGLLGNDVIEFGFKIYSSTWPPFTGVISGGTITVTPYPDFNNDVVLAPGNPGTTLIKQPPVAEKHEVVTCSVYCHGDNWAIPSGRAPVEPISWTNGPLGDCSNAVCHGTTPANPPTPSVATGAHGKHVGNLEYACTKCHDDYPNPHMVNGHVKWNLSALSPAATYRGFNIHSTTTLATTEAYGDCSNVYCHSNVQSGANGTGGATVYSTVRWGGGLLNCDGCHGGKKSDAAPIDSGNHGKHISTYAYDCADCHTNSGSDLPAKHGNQNIEVAMPASYGGSYDQEVNPPANGYGSCSANYCHSDGNGTTKSATWGGTLSCLGCHGGDAASGTPVVTGAHRQHVDNARIGSNYGCAECHANTVSGNETISSTALHVNKLRDYSGAKAGRDRAACNNAYCHSDGKGTPGIAVSWTSGPALTNCIGCHGADSAPTFASAAGEPNYANTGADTLKANNHQRHMGGVGSETCVYCHSSTVTSAGTIIAGSSTHTNSIREVRAGGGKTFDYELATKTCSNISCHGGPAPIKWGATLPVDCTGCHGGNLTSATPQTTGKHAAHMNNAAVLGTNYACVVCHALTVSDDRTISDPAFHGNGFKNYTGRLAGGRGSYTTATGVCSTAYCHSDGKGTQNVPFDAANGWKSAAALDCKGCHGNSNGPDFVSVAGEPNYASTGAGTPRANSHRNHVDDGVATCVYCHGTTVTGAGGIISESTTHILNRSIDVVAGGGKTFTYAAGKTCSNISCHGGKGSYDQVWGAPVSADCTGCHGNNAVSSAAIASGKHAAHINNPGLGVNYNCAECHAKTINADERTFADSALHGNGFFNYSGTRAGSYAAAAGGCSAGYCHTDGKGRQNVAFTAANGWNSSATMGCKGCHGNDPVFGHITSVAGEPNYPNAGAGQPRANSHQRHMGGVGAGTCVYCHSNVVTPAGALASGSLHTNQLIEVAPGGGKTFTWGADKTCSNINCHGTGSSPAQWGQSFPSDCTGCHGNNIASANPMASGKHAAHINNKSVLGSNYSCNVCHALTSNPDDRTIYDTSVHGNGFKNYTGGLAGSRNSYTLATGVCSASYCHSDGKGQQNVPFDAGNGWKSAATLDCKGCHGNNAAADFVSNAGEPNYASTGSGTARANSHRNHVDSGAASCVYCHGTTVTGEGAIIQESATHILNRSIDVVPGGGKTFTWAADKTCSNISCHGGVGSYTQTWGASVSADCTGCHGNNAASSMPIASGKHTAHINNPDIGGNFNCTECHAKTINSNERSFATPSLHGNGFLNYSGIRAGSHAPASGGCSASYCHTDGKGQQNVPFTAANGWNSAVTYANCIGCHGNDAAPAFSSIAGEPNYISTGAGQPRANSHEKHSLEGAAGCVYCHSETVTGAGALNNSGNHLDKSIQVLQGGGKTFTYLEGSKNCSNISCHGAGSPSATWGATYPADCTGCHGGNAAAGPNAIVTGKHAEHINQLAVNGENYGCAECHSQVVSADRTVSNVSLHVNQMNNYSGARAGKNVATCNTAYCHTDGKGAPGMAVSWTTGPAISNCIGCHGKATAFGSYTSIAGEPNYANAGAGLPLANSHRKHSLEGAASCVYCHSETVTGAVLNNSGKHLDRNIQVLQGGGKTFSYLAGSKNCSNISCHGAGSPSAVWGATFSADCTGCHGGNAAAVPNHITTGKHAEHISQLALNGESYGCAECHAQVVSADRTISTPSLHINQMNNYSGARAGKNAATCNAAYCHTDGKGAAGIAVSWTSGPAISNCIGCHGSDASPAFTSIAGEPNYASAGGNVLRSNSHRSHTAEGASTCDTCHNATVTAAGTAIKPGSLHLDRNIDVNFNSAKATATWNQLSRTCNNISCHSGSSAVWGDASSAGCKVCHGNLSAAHSKHIGNLISSDAVTFYNFTAIRSSGQGIRIGCANCHPTDSAKHRNGTVDLSINRGKSGGSYINTLNLATADGIGVAGSGITGTSGSNVSCALSYCHSNGKSTALTAGDFKASPNWYGPAPANRCGMCHDNPPQYAGQSHYVAASSLGDDGRPPYMDSGHMVGIHFDNVYKGDGANGFLGYSSSGDKAHGNPAVATTIGCYICHSGVVSSTQIDTYAMHGTGSRYSCSNCHSASTRTPLQPGLITDTARHINGKKDVAFPSLTFKTKAQLSNVANALGWSRNGSYKNAGSYDSMNLGTSTWDPATKTCLTACHVNQPNITWGASLRCFSCHANQ